MPKEKEHAAPKSSEKSEKSAEQTTDVEYESLKEKFKKSSKSLKNIESCVSKQKKAVFSSKRFKELGEDLLSFYDEDHVSKYAETYNSTINSMEASLKEFSSKQTEVERSLEDFMKQVINLKQRIEERQTAVHSLDKAKSQLASKKSEKTEKKVEDCRISYEKINGEVKGELTEFLQKRFDGFDDIFNIIIKSQSELFSSIHQSFQQMSESLIPIATPFEHVAVEETPNIEETPISNGTKKDMSDSNLSNSMPLGRSSDAETATSFSKSAPIEEPIEFRVKRSSSTQNSSKDESDINLGTWIASKPDGRHSTDHDVSKNVSLASPRNRTSHESEEDDGSESSGSRGESNQKRKRKNQKSLKNLKKEKKSNGNGNGNGNAETSSSSNQSFLGSRKGPMSSSPRGQRSIGSYENVVSMATPIITTPLPPTPEKIIPVFGRSLHDIGVNSVPIVVDQCITFLSQPKVLMEEGLLRQSGSKATIDRLRQEFNEGKDVSFIQMDPHAVAGLLKCFFRELPDPIIPIDINDKITAIIAQQNDPDILANISAELLVDSIKSELQELLQTIPKLNYIIFKELVSFLVLVCQNEKKNKMGINNILTCLTPSLRITPGIIKFCMEDKNFFFPET